MLKAQDYRQNAWNALNGKWGTMALCALIFELIMGACGGLSVFVVGGVALMLINGPLTLGFSMLSLNVARGEEVKLETLFDGFKNFLSAFLLFLINSIFIALWSLLLVVPGIIKSLSYGMSFYILADNPDMDPNEARKKSMAMMEGNKWRLFCLQISFIGWAILCVLTLGILTFWVMPYYNSAMAGFYQSLINGQSAYGAQPANAQDSSPVTGEIVNDAPVHDYVEEVEAVVEEPETEPETEPEKGAEDPQINTNENPYNNEE